MKTKYMIGSILIVVSLLLLSGCSSTTKINSITSNSVEDSESWVTDTNNSDNIEVTNILWKDEIKKIASSDKTENEKLNEVLKLAKNYKPTQDELTEFENYIVKEFRSGKYLSDLKNHEYMLTNTFKSVVVENNYSDKEQKPIDSFAFDFFQNIKYTYRGYETVDSESVKSNEHQMNKALS